MTEQVVFNKDLNRYEMDVDGKIVHADIRRKDGVLFIDYVEAPPALRGTGAAGRFMQGLMEQARAEKLRVTPVCGYAAAWIARHPEFRDMAD